MRRTTILNAEEIKRTPLKDTEATFYSEFQNSRLARVLQLLHRAGIHEADKRQTHEGRGNYQRDLYRRSAAAAWCSFKLCWDIQRWTWQGTM